MAVPPTAGVVAGPADVLAAPAGQGGALWRLSVAGRQLDANLIRVPPGERVAGHVEPDLDVLLCVLSGGGELETDAGPQRLEPGCVAWLPRGARRALAAGRDGLVYVTAHGRRPGLAIRGTAAAGSRKSRMSQPFQESQAPQRSQAPQGFVGGPAAVEEGGEAACLLHRICPGCDRPAEDIGARYCARCGTKLDS